jgi:4'-phosphopantetheinyl transferase EntD
MTPRPRVTMYDAESYIVCATAGLGSDPSPRCGAENYLKRGELIGLSAAAPPIAPPSGLPRMGRSIASEKVDTRMNDDWSGRRGRSAMAAIDPSLRSAIDAMALPGIAIGHRLISPGDEHVLMPDEARALSRVVVKRRRAAGAARIVARQLLFRFGHAGCSLPNAPSGAPVWPAGVVGSLAHDQDVAVAAVATVDRIAALGIDVEPAEELPPDLIDIVATPKERPGTDSQLYHGRLLFAAKEAVYKAVHPLDGIFLEHHDVQIDFGERKGTVCNGRVVELRFCRATHLIAVAFIRAPV